MYAEVKEAWKIVQEKHDEYSSQLESPEGEGQEDPWIDELDPYYFALQIKVDKYLESCKRMKRENEETKMKEQAKEEEEKAKAEEKIMRDKEEQLKVENQKRLLADVLIQRDQEHIRFQRSVDHIEELLGETNEDKCKYASEALKEAEVRLKERMDICEQIQQKYISNLESKEEKEKELGITIWETFNKICNKILMFIGQHGMKLKDKAEKGGGCTDQGSSFRLEKLRFQIFDGNVRKYPRFKSEFNKYVEPICNPDQVAFILRSYLSEEIKEEVDNLGDDLKDIWDCLDKKYGDQGKLIDAIMSEVKEMPFFEDDDEQGILLMINTIEKAHRDLLLLGLESEIINSTIVLMIEQKMPKEMEREWIKIVTGEKRTEIAKDKFPSLLKLLILFRERLEYEMSNIR